MKKEVLFLLAFAVLGVAFGVGVFFNSKNEASALMLLVYDWLASIITFTAFEGIATVCTKGKKYSFANVGLGVVASLLAVGLCFIV